MTELIITEKPAAAKKVADALAEKNAKKESYKGVPYYSLERGKNKILVASAVGHLFALAEKEKKGLRYPVFDIEWAPSYKVSKGAEFTKKYADALKKLAKDADAFVVATDYDVEGEVIGLNVVRYICNRNDARRMKFSTLTAPDLVNAYEHASPHLDWGQAEAGETRHFLDYYYGINLSRALTSAIKAAGHFKILSTGRVQGPALKIIVDREREIKAFKPVPYWQIELKGETKKQEISAWHVQDKFWEKEKADAIMKKLKSVKEADVVSVERAEQKQLPPHPFDLTTLQTEAYRCFGINPKETLAIAQELYTEGFISYPRTSSQQLPPAIGYAKILSQLAKQACYKNQCNLLLKKKNLFPHNGKKSDPAHPAIFPTGIHPEGLNQRQQKIYDLIVKRFMAVFAEPALRETMTVGISANGELFVAKGTRTVEKGWHVFYEPYVKLEELELPAVEKGSRISVKKIVLHADETKPPKRYTPSSIIRELEKRNLGTKATRSEIIDTLYKRNYIKGESIEATELGIHTIDVLEKHAPKIVDEELTRHFELQMEEIREGKKKQKDILREAREVLTDILNDFKKKEKEIGEGLKLTFAETHAAMTTVGKCPACGLGSLVVKRGRFGRFIACDRYPECSAIYKVPASGGIVVSDKTCEKCGYPVIKMVRKGKKPQEVCFNPNCPGKKISFELGERKCPQCKDGNLVVRKSVYGLFIACDKYPKCNYTERIKEEK